MKFRHNGLSRWLLLALAALFASASSSGAQMVSGRAMENFAGAFGLSGDGAKVQQTDFHVGGKTTANVLWPGENASITFHITVPAGYTGPIKFDLNQYGERAIPGDMWKPHVFKIADVSSEAVNVNLPANGDFVTIQPAVPATFGGYAIILEVPGKGRFFGASLCRTLPAEPGRVYMPSFSMDFGWPHEISPVVFNSFKKLGIKAARVEGGYGSIADAHPDWAMQNDITLMLCLGAANTPMAWEPLGRPRPWLTDDGAMMDGRKSDLAWMPQYDPQFKAYLKDVLVKWGWPNGPVNAVELWNEPWEGVSISGWGADTPRYRELYHVMADAVMEVRKENGLKVMIGGACSSGNTRDKLFSDGTDEFLPILDFVSIHYQGLGSDASLKRKWMNRTGEYGPVRVWDTESWIGNSEDRVAAVIATQRAIGQDRTSGIYYRNVDGSEKTRIDGKEYDICQIWSPGAAIAAADNLLGQRQFKEILFKNGLPWVFEFSGLPGKPGDRPADGSGEPNVDDSTLVVVGDLGQTFERIRSLFRSVGIKPDAKMEIPDGDGAFIAYDFYGNAVPSKAGKIDVPISGYGYFLRTNGTPGSFAKLVDAVKNGTISGVDPVEVVALDMTAPVQTKPTVRVRLTNVLNRPIQGKLSAKIEGLTLAADEQDVKLAANQTSDFSFTVSGGDANEANNYPMLATFDGADGKVEHTEVIYVNFISKRTITVDGNLDDWKGAIPQTTARHQPPDAGNQWALYPQRDRDRNACGCQQHRPELDLRQHRLFRLGNCGGRE